MKMTHGIAITLLLVNEVYGLDGIEFLKEYRWINAVTPTNITFKFSAGEIPTHIWQKKSGVRLRQDPGEKITLTPDQETFLFTSNHVQYVFTPVFYRNQQKGFRIFHTTKQEPNSATTNCVYITLSDPPVEMCEDDVEGEILSPPSPKPPPEDGIKYLKSYRLFESISVTPTNLIFKFAPPPPLRCFVSQEGGGFRNVSEYMAKDEAWILTPDSWARISFADHGFLDFFPIVFKNKQTGFRIIKTSYWWPDPTVTNAIAYLALSDTPVQVREEDVDMIMEKGEWKKFEGEGVATASPPNHEEPQPVTQEESVAAVSKPNLEEPPPTTDPEPPAGNATPAHENPLPVKLILAGALLILCLFAILYLLRGKMKR